MESKITYLKCFICCKNYNKLHMTEMNNNSMLIDEEEVSYNDLILDIGFLKIDSIKNNFICNECNDKLLSFHFFKRDIKKYSNFGEHLRKLDILSQAEVFLNEAANIEELDIIRDGCTFLITLQSDSVENENDSQDTKEAYEVLVCREDESNFEETQKQSSEFEIIQETQPVKYCKTSANTTSEELDWVKVEAKSSPVKITHKSSEFKCSICSLILHTSASLLQHLKSIHVVADKETNKQEYEKLKSMIESSRINLITKNGSETIWKCNFCEEKRVYKSEQFFKLHLKENHLKLSEDEAVPVADGKTDQEEENVDDEQEFEVTTEEFLVEEIDEFTPPAKKRKTNTLNDLNEEQLNWIRKEVAAGEIGSGKNKSFKCTVCGCTLSSLSSLTRHLRDLHLLEKDKEKKLVKQEVKDSEMMVNGIVIWKCNRCNSDQFYKSENSFKNHLRLKHLRATKVDTAFIAACKTTVLEADGLRNVWKCPNCSRVFRHRDSLRNHIKLQHPDMDEEEARKRLEEEKPTAASSVDENADFISRIALKLENKDVGKSSNYCNECGLKFDTSKQHFKPKVHRECHEAFKIIAAQTPSHKCEQCRTVFNSKISYNQHIMVHDSPESILPIAADGMANYGATAFKIPEGDADDAVDEAVWKCGHCSVRYFEENDCVSHIMMLHSSPLCCFLDNRTFKGSTGMSKYLQHMRNKHPELFPDLTFPCGSCNLEFHSIYEKLAHQKTCSSKKYECDHCDKRFQTKYQLQSHLLYDLGLSGVSCEFCGKRCITISDLKIHQNVHSQARPYECSLCPKSFKTPGARSTHMESHNGGHDCEICGVKLNNRTLYHRHKRFQHNQEFRESQHGKNICALCGKSFLRSAHFKQHMKLQHGIQQV